MPVKPNPYSLRKGFEMTPERLEVIERLEGHDMPVKITCTGDETSDTLVRTLLQDGNFDGDYVKLTWGTQPYKACDGYLFFDVNDDELRVENEDGEVLYNEIAPHDVRRIHIH